MPHRFIIDWNLNQPPHTIEHQFPPSPENGNFSVCIGSLNGDFLAVLATCLNLGHASYKDRLNPSNNWAQMVHLANRAKTEPYWPASRDISPHNNVNEVVQYITNLLDANFNFHPNPKINEIIFLGDLLCGSGPSTFINLVILEYISSKQINYKIILGYQDALLAAHNFDVTLEQQDVCACFDYFQCMLVVNWQETFIELYSSAILNKTYITLNIFENDALFLASSRPFCTQSIKILHEAGLLDRSIQTARLEIIWRNKISNRLQSIDTPLEPDPFIDAVINFCKNEQSTLPQMLFQNFPAVTEINLFLFPTDDSGFCGTNMLPPQKYPLFDFLPKTFGHLHTSYVFILQTQYTKNLATLCCDLDNVHDPVLLKIALRKLTSVNYFLDERTSAPILDQIESILPRLSVPHRQFIIHNIESHIAFLRSKRGVLNTQSIVPLLRHLVLNTNIFGLCAILSLLRIQTWINLYHLKQQFPCDATKTKLKKKDFYFTFVTFNKLLQGMLAQLPPHILANPADQQSIERFLDTPVGEQYTQHAQTELWRLFNINSEQGYASGKLAYIRELKNCCLIEFICFQKDRLSEVFFRIIQQMDKKNLDNLILFFGLSPHWTTDPFIGHALALSIQNLRTEIKIRFYDPNNPNGHLKYSIFKGSKDFTRIKIEEFFSNQILADLMREFFSISLFCLIPLTQSSPTTTKLFDSPLILFPQNASDISFFLFVSLRDLIYEVDTNFPIESMIMAMQKSVPQPVFQRMLNTTHDPITGHTLLTYAIGSQNPKAIKLLLDAGADPNVTNPRENNKTAKMYASEILHKNFRDSTASLICMMLSRDIS